MSTDVLKGKHRESAAALRGSDRGAFIGGVSNVFKFITKTLAK
jgi:hypothetical protein